MAEMRNFTQPDNSPTFFMQFLEFLDKHEDIRGSRGRRDWHESRRRKQGFGRRLRHRRRDISHREHHGPDRLAAIREMLVAASMPNSNSARELPSLAKQAGLKDIKVETFSASTPHEFFLRAIAVSLVTGAENGLAPRTEVDEFLSEQAALDASGDFFQMWLFSLVAGVV